MRWIVPIVGVLAVAAGAVFTLQGLGILGGSVMTGHTIWAVIGPILALIGLVLVVVGLRRGTASV